RKGARPDRFARFGIHCRRTDRVAGAICCCRDESMSPDVELLAHCREAFGNEPALWTATLLDRLCSRDESPWKDIHGKPLDDRGLARRLKGFSIRSRDVMLSGTNRKGYRAEDFDDAWKRYLPSSEGTSAISATSASNLNNQNKNLAHLALIADSPPTAIPDDRTCRKCHLDDGQSSVHDIGGGKVWLHRECVQFYRAGQ